MNLWGKPTAKHVSCEISSCITHFFPVVAFKKLFMFRDKCFDSYANLNLVLANVSIRINETKYDIFLWRLVIPTFLVTGSLNILRKNSACQRSHKEFLQVLYRKMSSDKSIHCTKNPVRISFKLRHFSNIWQRIYCKPQKI